MMRLAILYEDNDVFISYKPEEFEKEPTELIESGLTVKQALDKMIAKLKKATIRA